MDIDDECEALFWKFVSMTDRTQISMPLSNRDAFKRTVRPILCAASLDMNRQLRDQLAAALENVKDYKENSALFLRQRDEARTDLAAARALLRDCLPELDGEGVTIHRVWAALAKETK